MSSLWALHDWPGKVDPLWSRAGNQRNAHTRGDDENYGLGKGHCQCKHASMRNGKH